MPAVPFSVTLPTYTECGKKGALSFISGNFRREGEREKEKISNPSCSVKKQLKQKARDHRTFQIDQNIGVSNESVATFVLSEHRESPLRTTVRQITIQRLEHVDFAGSRIDRELGFGRILVVDTLSGEEVDDVLWTIEIAVFGIGLRRERER